MEPTGLSTEKEPSLPKVGLSKAFSDSACSAIIAFTHVAVSFNHDDHLCGTIELRWTYCDCSTLHLSKLAKADSDSSMVIILQVQAMQVVARLRYRCIVPLQLPLKTISFDIPVVCSWGYRRGARQKARQLTLISFGGHRADRSSASSYLSVQPRGVKEVCRGDAITHLVHVM